MDYTRDPGRLLEMPLSEAILLANRMKREYRQASFSLCSILNVRSGACTEDCAFCAQSSRYRTGAPVYPYRKVEEVVKRAREAKEAGASRFSLVASGRGPTPREVDLVAELVHAVRTRVGIKVCASLGIMDRDGLERLKAAGLSRYHHNLETSRRFFPRVVTTHGFEERVGTIRAAREAGLETCSGGIIGLGETWEDRLQMAMELRDLGVDSVPLNVLVPIRGTPLESVKRLPGWEILKTIAIFRVLLPEVPLRLAGGRESALKDMLGMAFWTGADAMLIGGYLTVRGRAVEQDLDLVKEVKELWSKG